MMSNSRYSTPRTALLRRTMTLAWLVCGAAAVSGCASTIADLPVVGLPAGTPARPQQQPAYPAVHDMPVTRETKPLTEAERKKLEAELAASRDRQVKAINDANAAEAAAEARKNAPPPPPAPPKKAAAPKKPVPPKKDPPG
jgi:hypothetical protein